MERRFFIAILLSIVVLYGYQALFVPAPQPTSNTAQKPNAPTQAPPVPAQVTEAPKTVAAPDVAPLPDRAVQPALVSEAAEREIVVNTETVKAVFTNRGGRLLHWQLLDYRDGTGKPVDLVPSNVPPNFHKPFSLVADDAAVTDRLNSSIYRVSGDTAGRLDARGQTAALVFEFQDAAGLQVRKEFRIDPKQYIVSISTSVVNAGQTLNPGIAWGPGLGDIGALSSGGSYLTGNYTQPPQAIYKRPGDREATRVSVGSVAEQPVHEGAFQFAGIDDHYFLAAAITPGQSRLEYQAVTLSGSDDTQRQLVSASIRLPQAPDRLRFFVGPKQFDRLQAVDEALGQGAVFVRAINFGWFGFLAKPLLDALTWVHGYIGNWGWSIIVLTILINLAIFPLRHKSVVSMRKMQVLQPQLKAIQDRYAGLKVTDPERQKMNSEIMGLYREKGVNPASGCVPMLLTLPVLFAFYSLLSQAIELRGARFGLWITDLSERDPYYITPVLMALTMFWQQKITPSTADPAQQRIMMIMPLMFGVMFLAAPSGLVLYWFVGNLFAIGQQYFTNWWIGRPQPVAARATDERRIKSAGAGRTAGAEHKN
jgi:YidC/Oxa1 family membrane protein insertase